MSSPIGTTRNYNESVAQAERISGFLSKTYGWMAIGLGITAVVAMLVAGSPATQAFFFGNAIARWGLFLVTLGMVWYISARVNDLAPGTAALLFAIYAALMGAMLSGIFLLYTGSSIATTFVTTAGMFGALALYGTVTRRNLAGVGQFAFMGLIGVVIASIVGIFWHNSMLQFVISVCGVVVFTGLTAWDAQRLKAMALALPDGRAGSYAIAGALALYLDFINLFLFLLRLFGGRRD
ncbi:MAG TPA: Bax inhibitor-1/YccA family protein [Gemmatimonadales bacterium]|nr:Bax inhibitor-1/YccA family protein [Gemmatimonadales bacterium]